MTRPRERAKSTIPVLVWIALAFAVGLAIWGGAYRYAQTLETVPEQIEDLGKAGLGLAFGGVLAGIVKLLFDAWTERRLAQQSDLAFYDQLLMDFKSVYNTVERARFLIASHRSARTYGEQMRKIPDAVIVLHNVRRATKQGFPELYTDLEGPIFYCIRFLKTLMKGYRHKYLDVSRMQSQDEANNKWYRDQIARGGNPDPQTRITTKAWDQIAEFDELAPLFAATHSEDLTEEEAKAAFKPYEDAFVQYIDLASYCLTLRLPGGNKRRTPEMEKRRRDCIDAVAKDRPAE